MDFAHGPLPPRRRPRGLKPESFLPPYAALKRRSSTVVSAVRSQQLGISSSVSAVRYQQIEGASRVVTHT